MSAEANQTVARRWVEESWNQGNFAVLDALTAADFVDHHLPPDIPPNAKGHKMWMQITRGGFPDVHLTIEDMIVSGDKVVVRLGVTGTQTGEYLGLPPSNKQINVTGIGIIRFADGKAVEYWENFDALGVMQQIGAIPSPEQSSS